MAEVASVAFDLPLESGFCSVEALFEVEVSSRSGSTDGVAVLCLAVSSMLEDAIEGGLPTSLYLSVILGSATIDECSLLKLRSDCASLVPDKLWRRLFDDLEAALDGRSPSLACWLFLELYFVIVWRTREVMCETRLQEGSGEDAIGMFDVLLLEYVILTGEVDGCAGLEYVDKEGFMSIYTH